MQCSTCQGRGYVGGKRGIPRMPCSLCLGGKKIRAKWGGPMAPPPPSPPKPAPPVTKPTRRHLQKVVTRFMEGWSMDSLAVWSDTTHREIEDAIRDALIASLRRQASRDRNEEARASWKTT